ncbi:hypothetical protein BBJ28_00004182 [Nothophytophthora sp. Chile5]|nr:hypothetical protein BBJ28_00004182 [Nothophytophthora sp. Chile5]
MMEDGRRKSSKKKDITVRNKFNAFLREHTTGTIKAGLQFDSLADADITEALIGSFATFLMRDVKHNTAKSVLSNLKRQLRSRGRIFEGNQGWYKNLRSTLRKTYSSAAQSTGSKLVESAPLMAVDDLSSIATALFERSTPTALRDRTLLLWQWAVMGRSSDVTRIRFSDLHWLPSGLLVDITRVKTSSEQSLALVGAPLRWQIDALRALACQLAADPFTAKQEIFPQLGDIGAYDNSSSHINAVLNDVTDGLGLGAVTAALSSHSSRRGAATEAASNVVVNFKDIAARGKWSTEAWPTHTVYNYIAATDASALKTARVLAGWESANAAKAVHHPHLARLDDGVSAFDAEAQRSFGKEVFKMFLSRLGTDNLMEALTSSLLLYYQDIYAHQKDHIVNKAMENALVRAIPTMDLNRAPGVLEKWGAPIRKAFTLENIASLPTSVLHETLTEEQRAARFVSVNTFEDGISRVLAIAQMLVGETQDLKAQLLDV